MPFSDCSAMVPCAWIPLRRLSCFRNYAARVSISHQILPLHARKLFGLATKHGHLGFLLVDLFLIRDHVGVFHPVPDADA